MCGRTTSYTSPARIAEIFDAQATPGIEGGDGPFWNVGPTSNLLGLAVPAGGEHAERLVLDRYRWGLIPSWSKAALDGNRRFNARAETVARTPAFRGPFRSRRLAVVVDGFFEWRQPPGGRDSPGGGQPFYFHRADGFPLTFAGLWDTWRDPTSAAWVHSCTVITTTAGADMDGIHDRMPVILERGQLDGWLRPRHADEAELRRLLRPAPADTLVCYPVDRRVGNVRNDSPDLIEPVKVRPEAAEAAPAGGQLRLLD